MEAELNDQLAGLFPDLWIHMWDEPRTGARMLALTMSRNDHALPEGVLDAGFIGDRRIVAQCEVTEAEMQTLTEPGPYPWAAVLEHQANLINRMVEDTRALWNGPGPRRQVGFF